VIISHEHRFIFVKTMKTAGTSVEVFLSTFCGPGDVVTPIHPPVPPHEPRNDRGWFNPLPEIVAARGHQARESLGTWRRRMRFYNHIPAYAARARIGRAVWDDYFVFTIERNPWEKVLSHYAMLADLGYVRSLDEYLARRPGLPLNLPLYTDPRNGRLLVDRVLRYESLDHDLGETCATLGLGWPGTLAVRAKSEHRVDRAPAADVFTDAQRDLVAKLFAAEIASHGYVFGRREGVADRVSA
jgi:hypothetical protein